jgi:hypothetical protein
MFKGRTYGTGVPITGHITFTENNGIFSVDDMILVVSQVYTDVQKPIVQGMMLQADIWIGTIDSECGYKICEVDNSNNILREIDAVYYELGYAIEGKSNTVCFEVQNVNCTGIAVFATHNMNLVIKIELLELRWLPLEHVDNPVKCLEHILLNQAGGANIKTSGEGSFLDPNLSDLKLLNVSMQVFDEKKAFTDVVIQSLCEQCFMCHYTDENGSECVKDYLKKENVCETLITFNDIIPGSIGKIIEPENIITQPIINYAYDYATDKFTKHIRIENVDKSSWSEEFTPGLTAADGSEAIWTEFHNLYLKYGVISTPENSCSDREWIIDKEGAIFVLGKMLQLMKLKKQPLSITYEKGEDLVQMQQVKIKLPHQTNDNEIQCTILQIDKDFEGNKVDLELLLLDEIETSFFFEE